MFQNIWLCREKKNKKKIQIRDEDDWKDDGAVSTCEGMPHCLRNLQSICLLSRYYIGFFSAKWQRARNLSVYGLEYHGRYYYKQLSISCYIFFFSIQKWTHSIFICHKPSIIIHHGEEKKAERRSLNCAFNSSIAVARFFLKKPVICCQHSK